VAALFLLLVVASFALAFAILGAAIGWPASLRLPASVVLPLIVEQATAVAIGYWSYLISSLLMIPMALLVRRVLDPGRASTLVSVATVLGVLSGLIKPLGIIRWLTAMPTLARAYVEPTATDAQRQTIVLIYTTLNDYAGGIGEVLGVAILGGLWALLIGLRLARGGRPLAWLGWAGIVAGLTSLVSVAQAAGLLSGPWSTVSGSLWYLWVLAFAVLLLRSRDLTNAEK
jgi:hypothetical protein